MKALVIDGYNAINKIPRLRSGMEKSLEATRRGITIMAEEYKRKVGGIDKVHVVFDGQDRYRYLDEGRCDKQIFSRTGQGDAEIIRTVTRLANDYHVVVVSDDNYVGNNARAHGATVISVAEFAGTIEKKSKVRPAKHSDPKISEQKAREINEELKRHWNI